MCMLDSSLMSKKFLLSEHIVAFANKQVMWVEFPIPVLFY